MIAQLPRKNYTEENGMTFIPPFDDYRIIEGQGTVGVEILEDMAYIDYLFIPIGGGGAMRRSRFLFSKPISPKTKIYWTRARRGTFYVRSIECWSPVFAR
jgi:threonine dehydratase